MSRRGVMALGILGAFAAISATAAAVTTGYIGLFSSGTVLVVLWWVVRTLGDVRATVAGQPTRTELRDIARDVAAIKLKMAGNLDQISTRATEVIFGVEERVNLNLADETRRRHQLREEFETYKGLTDGRLTKHGEKIAALGAKVEAWPPRKERN